jgi:XTP/dITP diphosphohydrolase
MEVIVATNNKFKINEIKSIFSEDTIYTLKDKKIDKEVEEDADTFLRNAKKKAHEIYNIASMPVIADDSGLCVNALNGFPGVMTHRFLGENATDKDRNEYIINEVKKCDDKSAKVVCELVYYNGEDTIVGEGIIEGNITDSRRGDNGFGFDEIFELLDGRTLAELTPEEKNKKSARFLAAKDLKEKLEQKGIY